VGSVGTVTTTEYWDWNGTPLNQPYWNITSFGGSRQDLPLLRGQNYPVAYRAGQMWRSKQPDQRTVSLAMWAAGIDQASLVPAADQRLAFNNNFQQMRSMFWQMGNYGSMVGFLTRRWYITQNGVTGIVSATAQAEIAGTMQPTMSGRTRADFTVDFLLADPYFYGQRQSLTVPANGSGTNLLHLGDDGIGFGQAPGSGGVAFRITLTGPLTAPVKLTNATNGVSVTVSNSNIAAGTNLVLDVLNYTAYTSSSVSRLGDVTHYGARPWMLLLPGNNVLVLSTGGSDSGNCLVQWQPGYL
jgi:hypothetical protein